MEGGECHGYIELEKQMTIFLGHAKKNGATEEEIGAIIKAIELIQKYLPFYKKGL